MTLTDLALAIRLNTYSPHDYSPREPLRDGATEAERTIDRLERKNAELESQLQTALRRVLLLN